MLPKTRYQRLLTKKFLLSFYQALVDTINHDGIEHAGYLAFLALLGLFPFLVLFISIVGFIGETDIGLYFAQTITDNQMLPKDIQTALEPRINEIISGPPQGLLTIAIVGAIWTASSAVEGLRTILNRAYRVGTPPAYIWRRLLSIGQFLLLTAITILVTFFFIITPPLLKYIEKIINYTLPFDMSWDFFRYTITTVILFIIVVILYYIIPNIKQRWRAVFPGALVVVALWFIGGSLFAGYLSNFEQIVTIYGSLGGIIAALLFFYIAAMILVYGAELNYHIETLLGHKFVAKEKVAKKKKE